MTIAGLRHPRTYLIKAIYQVNKGLLWINTHLCVVIPPPRSARWADTEGKGHQEHIWDWTEWWPLQGDRDHGNKGHGQLLYSRPGVWAGDTDWREGQGELASQTPVVEPVLGQSLCASFRVTVHVWDYNLREFSNGSSVCPLGCCAILRVCPISPPPRLW